MVLVLSGLAVVSVSVAWAVFDTVSAQGNVGLTSGVVDVEIPVVAKVTVEVLMDAGRPEFLVAMVLATQPESP